LPSAELPVSASVLPLQAATQTASHEIAKESSVRACECAKKRRMSLTRLPKLGIVRAAQCLAVGASITKSKTGVGIDRTTSEKSTDISS
jgi:hypothetical protein